jgi:hypothetical protein
MGERATCKQQEPILPGRRRCTSLGSVQEPVIRAQCTPAPQADAEGAYHVLTLAEFR